MKIDNNLKGLQGVGTPGTRPAKGRTGKTGAQPAPGDNVAITPAASRLSALASGLGELEAQDGGKVESVRQAIADGSFQVDEDAVATGLIQSTLEQLRAR